MSAQHESSELAYPARSYRVVVRVGSADGRLATVIATSGMSNIKLRFDEPVPGLPPGDPWYRWGEVEVLDG